MNTSLNEYKEAAKGSSSPKELFFIFDAVSKEYELGYIEKEELDEIKQIIWSSIRSLTALKKLINQAMQTA